MFTLVVPLDNPITMFWNDQPVACSKLAACKYSCGMRIAGAGYNESIQGLKIGTRARTKSVVSRDTTVRP